MTAAEEASPPVGSTALRRSFLRSFPGIGDLRAQRLLERFGDGLGDILKDAVAVREQLIPELDIRQGPAAVRIAYAMHARWPSSEAAYLVHAWLESHGVTEPAVARHMTDLCGAGALDILRRNPYALARALPWSTVDRIGVNVLASHIGRECALRAPQRLLGACDRTMADRVARGDTAVAWDDFVQALAARLHMPPASAAAKRAVQLALRHRRLVQHGNLLRSPGCAWMERSVARRLAAWAAEPGAMRAANPGGVLNALPAGLYPEQADAAVRALGTRFSVLAGGAGTGKTTTLRAIALAWESSGGRVQLATLSGKAAMRLSEATGRPAKTIHRLLAELARADERNSSAKPTGRGPALLDASTLLVIDEASMVDLGQWMKISERLEASGASLLMAGDVAQLPPIGPGLVFHHAAALPEWTANLSKIHRQTERSGIPVVASALRKQRLPSLAGYGGKADGVFSAPCPGERIDEVTERIVGELGGFCPDGHDLQVVSALNDTSERLNRRFHDRLRGEAEDVRGHFGNRFSVGDPVIHLENDYGSGLLNGTLGHVVRTSVRKRSVIARFDGREHYFPSERLGRLALAYSLTCHKLQGSQSKRVLIIVEPTRLLDPSWLYTSVTRAEHQAILIGPPSALADAMRRIPAHKSRVTAFAHELAWERERHGR